MDYEVGRAHYYEIARADRRRHVRSHQAHLPRRGRHVGIEWSPSALRMGFFLPPGGSMLQQALPTARSPIPIGRSTRRRRRDWWPRAGRFAPGRCLRGPCTAKLLPAWVHSLVEMLPREVLGESAPHPTASRHLSRAAAYPTARRKPVRSMLHLRGMLLPRVRGSGGWNEGVDVIPVLPKEDAGDGVAGRCRKRSARDRTPPGSGARRRG